MAKEFSERIYKSKRWQRLRKLYFELVYGLCERCGGVGKILHHKIELTPENINDIEIVYGFDNLELLCTTCHNQEHHREDREDYYINELGELIKKI